MALKIKFHIFQLTCGKSGTLELVLNVPVCWPACFIRDKHPFNFHPEDFVVVVFFLKFGN